MNRILSFIKTLFASIANRIPTKLPQGITEFEAWASSIIQHYKMPDNDSIRFALAVSILHLPSTASHMPKHFFGKTLLKGAASQVAGGVMQDLKDKQKAEATAAALVSNTQPVAAVTTPEVVVQDAAQTSQKN